MSNAYYLNVTVHLLAALLWLGGMLFFAAVGAPVLRQVDPPELRAQLFRRFGERFRLVGWIAVGVLLVTGVLNLWFRGLLSQRVLTDPLFWSSRYGHALAWKLALVTAMIVISVIHDFVHGPAASRAEPGSSAAQALRRRAALLARFNAALAVAVIYFAARLARGG